MGTVATLFERKIASLSDLIAELKAGRMQPLKLAGSAVVPPT